MANNLRISFGNGIFKVERDLQVIGQGRTIETAIQNGISGAFPGGAMFMAAEVIANLMGPTSETHGQIHTKEPQ